MLMIQHRQNTCQQLAKVPEAFGVEIDVRTRRDRLILQHDPFKEGEDFEAWLSDYHHAMIIVNLKEDGLESAILSLLKANNIENFFFLDQMIPTLVKTVRAGETRCAVRLSEFETIETVLKFSGLAEWVWLDSFDRFFHGWESLKILKNRGFKLCVVSPELQQRTDPSEIDDILSLIQHNEGIIDAVCTKKIEAWCR